MKTLKNKVIVIHGLMGTGKTLAMKALLHQMKEEAAAVGENFPIVSDVYCCFADSRQRFDGSEGFPQRSLVGLNELFLYPNPTSVIRQLLKSHNFVITTAQEISNLYTGASLLSHYIRQNVTAYIKPRLYPDKDMLCLDWVNVLQSNTGMLPNEFVRQASAFGDISKLYCNCHLTHLYLPQEDAS